MESREAAARILLAFAGASGSVLLLSMGPTLSAVAGSCLLCIWQAATKDPAWTIHLLLGIWFTLLYPITIAQWRSEWTSATRIWSIARDRMLRWGISPLCIDPGYSRLELESRPISPSREQPR